MGGKWEIFYLKFSTHFHVFIRKIHSFHTHYFSKYPFYIILFFDSLLKPLNYNFLQVKMWVFWMYAGNTLKDLMKSGKIEQRGKIFEFFSRGFLPISLFSLSQFMFLHKFGTSRLHRHLLSTFHNKIKTHWTIKSHFFITNKLIIHF